MADYIIEVPVELTVRVPDDVRVPQPGIPAAKVRSYTVGELLGPFRRWLKMQVTYLSTSGEGAARIHDELFSEGEGPLVVGSSWSGALTAYEVMEDGEPRLILATASDEGEEGLE